MLNTVIFNIQRFSLNDGPGIRTTVFLKGCNLRCFWCHNPESQRTEPEVQYQSQKCIQCAMCIDLCPAHAISIQDNQLCISHALCIGCGKAEQHCPTDALSLCGEILSVDDVFTIVQKDIFYYKRSKGGATLSGGEPMLHPDWVEEFFYRCKQQQIHTCISTAGHVPFQSFEQILPYTDLFLFDIKHLNRESHQQGVGVPNDRILENIKQLSQINCEIIVRVPIIPDFNDSTEAIAAIANFIANETAVTRMNLLPFHKMGENKYSMLGKQLQTQQLQEPDAIHMQLLHNIVSSYHLITE